MWGRKRRDFLNGSSLDAGGKGRRILFQYIFFLPFLEKFLWSPMLLIPLPLPEKWSSICILEALSDPINLSLIFPAVCRGGDISPSPTNDELVLKIVCWGTHCHEHLYLIQNPSKCTMHYLTSSDFLMVFKHILIIPTFVKKFIYIYAINWGVLFLILHFMT